ncbi:MAG: hypothetical protein DMG57_37755 [Acidobacteria bacterium]|nr:MAG: hypothetical protein DMG57_37755 [Acidobacteriota bacterium]
MRFKKQTLVISRAYFIVALVAVLPLFCQQSPAPLSDDAPAKTGGLPQPMNWTAAEDHQNMMEQLGIKALRPGPAGMRASPTMRITTSPRPILSPICLTP